MSVHGGCLFRGSLPDRAGGTHPTGMHSCFANSPVIFCLHCTLRGRSRIFQRGPNLNGGANLFFRQIFLKTEWKWWKLYRERGSCLLFYYVDPLLRNAHYKSVNTKHPAGTSTLRVGGSEWPGLIMSTVSTSWAPISQSDDMYVMSAVLGSVGGWFLDIYLGCEAKMERQVLLHASTWCTGVRGERGGTRCEHGRTETETTSLTYASSRGQHGRLHVNWQT